MHSIHKDGGIRRVITYVEGINTEGIPTNLSRRDSNLACSQSGRFLAALRRLEVLDSGAVIVTDTNMAKAGINKAALSRHGCECMCFMADADVAETAKQNGTTRATASVDKAAALGRPVIYAVGNAPTALVRLCEHISAGDFIPEFVIGAPVGFVNVVQSKELLIASGIPCIVARGRKGGSNVAAAICNALLYMLDEQKGYKK